MDKYRFDPATFALIERSRIPFAVYQFINGRVVTIALSAGFCDQFGFDDRAAAYDLMDNGMYRDTHPDDIARAADAAVRFATEGGTYDVVYRSKVNGVYCIVHATGEHIYAEDGTRLAIIWYVNEGEYAPDRDSGLNGMLGQRLREEGMLRQVRYDYLTGLPTMTYFFELAESAQRAAQARGEVMAILFMDLNGMRRFNEKHGFAEGDRLIRAFAGVLIDHFGDHNCSRFGQDHFAVVTTAEGLEDKLRAVFKACEDINGGRTLPVRAGIYLDTMGVVGASTACDRAQLACNLNRGAYVSQFSYYNETMRAGLEHRQYILDNLDRAIRERWIRVYYQPIVRAANGRVCDEEALARWIDPERGMLSPGEFIPILEAANLIYKLDLCVVEQALEKMKDQAAAGLHVVPESVNLSRSDFDACDIVEEIRKRVDASGIGRDKLTIEITESVIGSDFEFMKRQVERFQALGFQVWMDDFGSGYSSLDVLQSIHFDLIKFDMRFMQQFDNGEKSRIILTELIRMAIGLGIETVAEGVEREDQAAFLREVGCTKLQGFYYCKPIPLEEIIERNRKGIQIGFENPAESEYYASIGHINLYDLAAVSSEDSQRFDHYFDTLPMAIMESDGEGMTIARCNKSYRDFMARMFGAIEIGVRVPFAALYSGPGSAFARAVEHIDEGRQRAFINEELSGGATVHALVRRVAVNPVTGITASAVAVLGIIDESARGVTYAHVAQALSADYINLYHVNLDTGQFSEYNADPQTGNLAMERHGDDFFATSRRDAAGALYEADVDQFVNAFTKENVVSAIDAHGAFTLTYRLMIGGEPKYVSMKAVRMSATDNHIIIGVNNVDAQMKQREALERLREEQIIYNRINALSGGFIAIYTVDPVTNSYHEYSATQAYEGLMLAKSGEDFFAQARSDSERALHPDDIDLFRVVFTRENVMRGIRENGLFTHRYRLLIDGKPRYVTLRAAQVDEKDGPMIIIGVADK